MGQQAESRVSDSARTIAQINAVGHGRVVFVGSGLSRAEQLTRGGLRALRVATLVVTTPQLWAVLVESGIELEDTVSVAFVEDLDDVAAYVVAKVREGETVARLVRGDPLLEGNIGPEVAVYTGEGLMIDVVPGVPSLTSVTTLAGVSFPNQSAHLVSVPPGAKSVTIPAEGSIGIGCDADQVTMVCHAAIDACRSGDDEVLVIHDGGTLLQHSELHTINELIGKKSPVTPGHERIAMVLGPAAKRAEGMNWFESKPLRGWEILVPLTRNDSAALISRLTLHGAHCTTVPTIGVEPPRNLVQLDKSLRGLVDGHYRWVIFTSVNAVQAVLAKIADYGLDTRALSGVQVAAVGEETNEELGRYGIVPDLNPIGVQTVAGLAAEFPAFDDIVDPINTVFVPRAEVSTDPLSIGLADLGWEVDDVTAYRTVRAAPPPEIVREAIKTGSFDAVVFTSSTAVRNLVGIAGKPHAATVVAAIGPATAQVCVQHGLEVTVVAEQPKSVELADGLALAALRRAQDLAAAGKPFKRPSQRRRRRAAVPIQGAE